MNKAKKYRNIVILTIPLFCFSLEDKAFKKNNILYQAEYLPVPTIDKVKRLRNINIH